jgi:MFS family permease
VAGPHGDDVRLGDLQPPREVARGGIRRVLSQAPFRYLVSGLLLSNTGMWFQNLASAILVYKLTHSSLQVGIVNFAQFGGTLLLTPLSGNAADRLDRRRLLVGSQVFASLVTAALALLTLAGKTGSWMVVFAAAGVGISIALRTPAQLALVPQLVERRDLESGISLNSIASSLPRATAPLMAILVLARLDAGWAFAVNAVLFALAGLLFGFLPAQTPGPGGASARPKLIEVARGVHASHLLWAVMIATFAFSATTDPAYTLTPQYAWEVLGGGATLTAILAGAFGAGGTIAGLLAPSLLGHHRRALPATMIAEAGGIALFAVAWNGPAAAIGLAIAGAGAMASVNRSATLLQLETSPAQLGRVMAMWTIPLIGARPLMAIPDGLMSDLAGPRVASAAFIAPALIGAWYVNRALRRRDRQLGENTTRGCGTAPSDRSQPTEGTEV